MSFNHPTPEHLSGNIIHLEPLNAEHYGELQQAADDERIWAYMPMKANGPFFDDWFSDVLKQHNDGTQITYAIRKRHDQTIIGSCSYYDIDLTHKRLEIGYGWCTPAVWGSSHTHESLYLFFYNAFENWQFNRVQIATDPCNKRSYNTLKKLGATEEGILREHMIHHNGLITDTVVFSILAAEWPQLKAGLKKRLYTQ